MRCESWALPECDCALCDLCGLCVEACPQHGIHLGPQGPIFDRQEDCDACGSCEDACPQGAIVIRFEIAEGQEHSASEGERDER